MLSTLLQIGKILRESPDGLKHHRYIKQAPQPDPADSKAVGNETRFFKITVNADGSFRFTPKEFHDQYLIEKLFYLNYKTSDADSYKKYIFGDIWKLYSKQGSKINEDGNFRFGDPNKTGFYGLNSFERGESDANNIKSTFIANFRRSFASQIESIESFLHEHHNAFLHFDFQNKHWYELEEMSYINKTFASNFTKLVSIDDADTQGYILKKYLYKTLITSSGNIPMFSAKNQYKNKVFESESEVMDLLYAIDISTKAILRKADVKVIVLPRGDGLTAQQIENFFTRRNIGTKKGVEKVQGIRGDVDSAQTGPINPMVAMQDETFAAALQDAPEKITQFDFIFSKAGGGPSSPDIDMIEISGLQRGLLEQLDRRIIRIREEIEKERPKSSKIYPLSIIQSFLNILGDSTRAKKKYQNHLLKVLPQIYTGTYYRDDMLLPAFIEKTEFNIRDGKTNFDLMKFDFYFLTKIQNSKEDRLMQLKNSQSYQVGLLLGRLASQFSGSQSPIKAFEKNYVGLLSRRIGSLSDVIKLTNDINQKLVMHERNKFTHKTSHELAQKLKDFQETYNKEECAFGFFEGYFERWITKEKKEDSNLVDSEEVDN